MELLRERSAERLFSQRKMLAGLAAAALGLSVAGCGLGTETITIPKDAQRLGNDQGTESFVFTREDRSDAYRVDCGDVGAREVKLEPNGDVLVSCSSGYDQKVIVK